MERNECRWRECRRLERMGEAVSPPLCFIDTETTSLRPDRRVWDVAVIQRVDGRDRRFQWYIDSRDLDLGNADLTGLRIGRFHDRHPEFGPAGGDVFGERFVLSELEDLTRGAHLVGAVPSFDADVLDRRMRAHGILPAWHYHLVDVEAMAVGYLHGRGLGTTFEVDLPWRSERLSGACGVGPPNEEDRHTALGDVDWVARWFDVLTGGVGE